jgi:dienelactone hydrolase
MSARSALWAVPALLVGTALAGCGHGRPGPAEIVVDTPVAPVDRAVHIRVTGLAPRSTATVALQANDHAGRTWRSWARFTADRRGSVDLDRSAATAGTYRGTDGMGLFWSQDPVGGRPNEDSFGPTYPYLRSAYEVQLTVEVHGHRVGTRTLQRQWYPSGVTLTRLSLVSDGIDGVLARPPDDGRRHPAVLLFGGSEGGNVQQYTAALLAAHGFPALSIAYFGGPGLPATLKDIPLEYFVTAARRLAATAGVDPAHVLALGYSRGSEAALLLAQNFPDLFHGCLLYAPSAYANPSFPGGTGAAWTLRGAPVPNDAIPADRISGPVLAIAGDDDRLWTSTLWAHQIDGELTNANSPYPHQALIYHGAGHLVGWVPYLSAGTTGRHPVTGEYVNFGGTRAADAASQHESWTKVLDLLAGLNG